MMDSILIIYHFEVNNDCLKSEGLNAGAGMGRVTFRMRIVRI